MFFIRRITFAVSLYAALSREAELKVAKLTGYVATSFDAQDLIIVGAYGARVHMLKLLGALKSVL